MAYLIITALALAIYMTGTSIVVNRSVANSRTYVAKLTEIKGEIEEIIFLNN